ncbi:alginate export protein [Ulvibacter sp. MAR_2010_11]|nr:alginate export protein [Ulvibacter sp. MAR_2010_11]
MFLLFAEIASIKAQFLLDTELRPRFEYRHGFKSLFPNNEDPATFVSQRTRLNSEYTTEKLKFRISLQDVRVWGDVPQLNTSDNNGISLHEAWGMLQFSPEFALKIGRQEVVYDDHRIFGNVGWAQQARSHDLALIRYTKDTFKTDIGYAFNQDSEKLTGHVLTTNTYKSLFYLWMHKDWETISASVLFLNSGLQYLDEEDPSKNETRYGNTAGTHLTYKKGKFSLSANAFYQFGTDIADNNLDAYLGGLEAGYTLFKETTAILGGEIISGNDLGSPNDATNNAFTPQFGTNHKFNGYMDYFYVGNHLNNVGLIDLYARFKVPVNQKSKLDIALHNFSGAAEISTGTSKQLGTEIDMVYSYDFSKEITFQAGYSHLFASEGMRIIKNNFDDNTNNWAWLMVTIHPVLFSSEKNQ